MTQPQQLTPANRAFNHAIKLGYLNEKPGTERYAGRWMYMNCDDYKLYFKNINTRKYIHVPCLNL